MVIYGGNFSRINRRPQPGIGVFLPDTGRQALTGPVPSGPLAHPLILPETAR